MMLRRKIATTLVATGIILLLFGLGAMPALGAAPASALLQPSPRPALTPLHHASGQAAQFGHITGTVIDLATGAPAPGVAVAVGEQVVKTDANGNYDCWLPVGTYLVALALADGQGAPVQEPMVVSVQANAATVQHLNFQASAAMAATPTLAATSAAQRGAPKTAGAAPKRLPRTGSESYAGWVWLMFGALLLAAGGLVGFGPVLGGRSPALVLRAQAANAALLRTLLAAPARAGSRRPAIRQQVRQDDFLAELLERESPRVRN